jgi:hypothetical protein
MPQNYDNEFVVQDAWHRILILSFPMAGEVNGQPVGWTILRSTSRYPPIAQVANGLSLSALKLTIGTARPDLRADITSQDYLLVQTARPRSDTPVGWRDLLVATSTKLSMSCGQNQIFVLCAIGLKYMSFFWEPHRANYPPTFVRGSPPTTQNYALPPQLVSLGPAPYLQRLHGGMIVLDHTQALRINPDPICNSIGLEAMEQFLFTVKTVILSNANITSATTR